MMFVRTPIHSAHFTEQDLTVLEHVSFEETMDAEPPGSDHIVTRRDGKSDELGAQPDAMFFAIAVGA